MLYVLIVAHDWHIYVYLSSLPKYPSGFPVIYYNCPIKCGWTVPVYSNGTAEGKT